jgi:hypothetical protein
VRGKESVDLPGIGSSVYPVLKPLDDEIVELYKKLQVEPYGAFDAVHKAKSETKPSTVA